MCVRECIGGCVRACVLKYICVYTVCMCLCVYVRAYVYVYACPRSRSRGTPIKGAYLQHACHSRQCTGLYEAHTHSFTQTFNKNNRPVYLFTLRALGLHFSCLNEISNLYLFQVGQLVYIRLHTIIEEFIWQTSPLPHPYLPFVRYTLSA